MNIEKLKQIKDSKIAKPNKSDKKIEEIDKESKNLAQNIFNQLNLLENTNEIESKLYSVVSNISDDDIQELLETFMNFDYDRDTYSIFYHIYIPKILYVLEKNNEDLSIFNMKNTNCSFSYNNMNGFEREYCIYEVQNLYYSTYDVDVELKRRMIEYLDTKIKDKIQNFVHSTDDDEKETIYNISLLPNMNNVSKTVCDLLSNRLEEFGCKIVNTIIDNVRTYYDNKYLYECFGVIEIKNPINKE